MEQLVSPEASLFDQYLCFCGKVNWRQNPRDADKMLCYGNAGYRVGRQLVERYAANRPRLGENLDVIKFICKEFWNEVFHKQVSLPLPSVIEHSRVVLLHKDLCFVHYYLKRCTYSRERQCRDSKVTDATPSSRFFLLRSCYSNEA